MAAKTRKTSRKKARRAQRPNYVIVGRGGKLLLISGSTGRAYELNPEETRKIMPLLKERQQLGNKITQLLGKAGFEVADDESIDWCA